MPNLAATWDIPNPYGLLAGDFGHDLEAYAVALKFLSDLAGGTPEAKSLEQNGGSPIMLRAWQTSEKFRRVLSKCRAAGAAEAELRAAREAQAEETPEHPERTVNQRFIPLEDIPGQRSAFSFNPNPGDFGAA